MINFKLKTYELNSLQDYTTEVLALNVNTHTGKMILEIIKEIHLKVNAKILFPKKENQLRLTPVQALGLHYCNKSLYPTISQEVQNIIDRIDQFYA